MSNFGKNLAPALVISTSLIVLLRNWFHMPLDAFHVCSVFVPMMSLTFLWNLLKQSAWHINLPLSGTELSFLDPSDGNARKPFPRMFPVKTDETETSTSEVREAAGANARILRPRAMDLSVIVPAYNEEERLPVMLDEALEYLEARRLSSSSPLTYEVIIVDDGSKDKTSEVALKYVAKHSTERIRVLTQIRNRGKGGAIRSGVLSSRGKYILFVDADGATKFSDFDKVEALMKKIEKNGHGIVCGSRAHLQQEAVVKRSFLRNCLMWGFHLLVWLVGVGHIKDTQCGFKLFTRESAKVLFQTMHVERWCFDIELLFVATRLNYPLAEQIVNWQEIPGSKLSPLWSSLQMFKDILLIRLYYLTGIWRLPASERKVQ